MWVTPAGPLPLQQGLKLNPSTRSNVYLETRRAASTTTRIETIYFDYGYMSLDTRRAASTTTRIETLQSSFKFIFCKARRAASTTTRIETVCCNNIHRKYLAPAGPLPLQQGLKLVDFNRIEIPSGARRAASTTTRIETNNP